MPRRKRSPKPRSRSRSISGCSGCCRIFSLLYDWHAPALNTRQKYQLGWKTVLDPVNLVLNAGFAGVQQAANEYSGYGQGASGYFKRFGAANADFAVGTMLGGSVLPALVPSGSSLLSIRARVQSDRARSTLFQQPSLPAGTMANGSRLMPASWAIWEPAPSQTSTTPPAIARAPPSPLRMACSASHRTA